MHVLSKENQWSMIINYVLTECFVLQMRFYTTRVSFEFSFQITFFFHPQNERCFFEQY